MENRLRIGLRTSNLRGWRSTTELTVHLVGGLGFEPRISRVLNPACLPVASAAHMALLLGFEPRFPGIGDPGAFHGQEEVVTRAGDDPASEGLEDLRLAEGRAMAPL